MTAHVKINYETGYIGRFSEKKKNKVVSKTIITAKMELFVALVRSCQPLTNFTKNPSIGAMEVLSTPLEYYKSSEICAGDQIKYCRTLGISSYLAK